MEARELAAKIVKILDEKKAQDIKVLKIDEVTSIADYFVIAGGGSTTQIKTLADEVDYQLGLLGIEPKHREGYQSAVWVLLDYADVVVHVFNKESRTFYSLERLWNDAIEVDVQEFLK